MLFPALLIAATAFIWASRRPPTVHELDPDRASPGQTVSVVGRNFSTHGRLEVDGIALNQSVLRSWSDNLIVFTMPRELRSGMVRVQTEIGTSNPLFLTNQDDLPRFAGDRRLLVRSVSRREAGPGTVVTVQGENFGPRTARTQLGFFYPRTGEEILFPGNSWWIIQWANRQLQFVIPPDVPSGPVYLVLEGEPLETDLMILPATATVEHGDAQALVLRQYLQFQSAEALAAGAVRAVLARLPELPEQPSVDLLEETGVQTGESTPAAWVYNPAPVTPQEGAEESPGDAGALPSWEAARWDRVERRSARWEIQSVAPVETLLQPDFRRAFQRFLTDRDGVPVYSPAVGEIRRASINLRNTPLVIARLIHREVQRRLTPDRVGTRDLSEALDGAGAASLVYADLATALLRISGLPARRHFGVLLADNGTAVDHVWIEVFLPGVGWIPMDPALGDGMYGEEFSAARAFYREDLSADTFGALDDRRITVHVDGFLNPNLFAQGSLLRPADHSWSGPVLRLESERTLPLENLAVQWEQPHVQFQN